jgi:transcriptional regulator with XRE-family HTH domain
MRPDQIPPMRRVHNEIGLGAIVRETRQIRGWTQEELARQARVSRRWVIAMESGKATRAEVGRLLDVLEVLGIPMAFPPRSAIAAEQETAPSPDAPDAVRPG